MSCATSIRHANFIIVVNGACTVIASGKLIVSVSRIKSVFRVLAATSFSV